MHFISIGVRGAAAATLGIFALAGCGGSEQRRTPGEPARVAECTALIRAQLYFPDSFQLRSAIDDAESRRRQTRIVFVANMRRWTGPDQRLVSDTPTTCEAACGITDDGQLEPRLKELATFGEPRACLAARTSEAAH